jgi:asparagine synthase (glutamine-hydrolysing)
MISSSGLVFNSPFFDPRVVRNAFEVPEEMKITKRSQKYVLRQAFKELLPIGTSKRRKTLQRLKQDLLLTTVIEQMAQTLLSRAMVVERGLFEPNSVDRILFRKSARPYAQEQFHRIWSLLLTELWCRIYLDSRGRKSLANVSGVVDDPQVRDDQGNGREHTKQPCKSDTRNNPHQAKPSEVTGR